MLYHLSEATWNRLICSFNITGNATSQGSTGSTLQTAAVECTGGTLAFLGGPALSAFNTSFKGGI